MNNQDPERKKKEPKNQLNLIPNQISGAVPIETGNINSHNVKVDDGIIDKILRL